MIKSTASRQLAKAPCLLALLALAFTACDSTTNPDDFPTPRTSTIRSVDPIEARFFRLTAPVSFYFNDPASFPLPLQDGSFDLVQSDQNPDAPWRIDYATLQVYRSRTSGTSEMDTVDDAVAYLDPSGLGFEGFGAATGLTPGDSGPNPGYPESGFDPALALANEPQQFRARWDRLDDPADWSVLEVNGQVIGIQLARPASDDEVIACSYAIIDADSNVVRRAGRSAEDGDTGRIDDPNQPGVSIHYFKLLKPGAPVSPPFESGSYTEFALTWEYEYRNFYDLGGRDIPRAGLQFDIVSTYSSLDPPDRMPSDLDPAQTRFVRTFGLDRQSVAGVAVPDGLADVQDQNLFFPQAGYMRFPHPTPMNLPDSVVSEYTDGELTTLPAQMRASRLYTNPLTGWERDALHHFDFEVIWLEE